MAKNKIGVNQRNPRLINDLRSTKDYVRKNNLFLKNKANFQKTQMNVNKEISKDYVVMDTWWNGKKQSQTKPNKAKTNPILAQKCRNKSKTNPNQAQFQTNDLRRVALCQ